MATPFVGSAEWLALVAKPTTFVSLKVIREFSDSDVRDVLSTLASGSRDEQRVALGILRSLARRSEELREVPWTNDSRAALVRLLEEQTRADYSKGAVSEIDSRSPMRALWAELDPAGCVQFLLSLDFRGLPPDAQRATLRILAWKSREVSAARQWLDARIEIGDASGIEARDILEDLGIVTEERVDYWGRRWRGERDPAALTWLYDKWLSYLPVGHPMDHLLSVLGPPDDGTPPDIYYKSAGCQVYVEVYESTGFSGCHRT